MNRVLQHIWILFLFTCGMHHKSSAGDLKKIPDHNLRIRTVVIDPGHGGKDPGAVYGKVREKEIVLDIALKLGNYIQTTFPDVKVIYTRDKDVFVPLFQIQLRHPKHYNNFHI